MPTNKSINERLSKRSLKGSRQQFKILNDYEKNFFIFDNDNGTSYATYKEAIAANDFEAAHKIMAEAEADLAKCESADGRSTFGKSERRKLVEAFAAKYGFKATEDALNNAKKDIFDKEIKFLAADGSSEACARLVFLFSDYEISGEELAPGINSYYDQYKGQGYSHSVQEYNNKLDIVLDLAISQNNQELAGKVVKLYKQNMDVFLGGSGIKTKDGRRVEIAPDGTEVDGNHCYVTFNWRDKEDAQKKYEEHFGK